MTKIRFYLNLIFALSIFILGCFLAAGVTIYIDPFSLVFSVVVPYLVASFIYTPTEQRKMINACFNQEDLTDEKTLKGALNFFKTLKSLIYASMVATSLMGVIGMMANLEDTSMIGPNMAVALICPFYSMLFILIVVEPLRASAEKRLG